MKGAAGHVRLVVVTRAHVARVVVKRVHVMRAHT